MKTILAGCCTLVCLSVLLIGCQAYTPARGYLTEGDTPESEAYGYLVFTKMPSVGELQHYTEICTSYLNSFPPYEEYDESEYDSLMITYWLLKESPTGNQMSDCEWLIDRYDYAWANKIASSLDMSGVRGPILVAKASGEPDDFTFDMSDFRTQDIDRAFRIWKDRISRNPEAWQSGFSATLFREAFRNLLEEYGDSIMKIIRGGTSEAGIGNHLSPSDLRRWS